MSSNDSSLATRVTAEFAHSPVTFVASIFALLDVLYRLYEVIRSETTSPEITIPKVTTATIPSPSQAALYLILFIFLALLAQNFVSFIWYKFMSWISGLPSLALISLTFLLCALMALLSAYNMLTLSENIAQLYRFTAHWTSTLVFTIAAVIAAFTTIPLMISLVEEYDKTHSTNLESFGVVNLMLYLALFFVFAALLAPRY